MSKVRKIFKVLSAVLLLPLVIAVSFYSLEQQGFFKINVIDLNVTGLNSQKKFVAPKVSELKKSLEIYRGISLWKAPLSQISETLKDQQWIKEFQISREWPAGISINIKTDDVALLVFPQSSTESSVGAVSSIKPITRSGKILEKINSKNAPDAIVTFDPQFLINQKIREGGLQVIGALPKTGKLTQAHISEIGYDRKEGYWVKLLNSETKVNLGEEQFEIKSARIAQVIEYLEGRNLKARVIDANLSKKVLVRLQQSP